MSMTFLVSLPILGFLGSLVKSAIDFEDAFAGVIKTVDGLVVPGTLNELNEAGEALQRNFREMALEIPISAIELSKLGQVAGQLGVRGVNNITSFVDAVARIGAATDLSSEDAGRFLAQIIAIQGPMTDAQLTLAGFTETEIENISASEKFQAQIQAVGGTLVHLGNNLPTTEESIARFSQRIAASGKLANITTSEIFGIGAAFASVGIPAERGGTAVQKTFIKIIEAVQNGGNELKIFAKTADVTTEEFVTAFSEGSDKAGYTFERFVRGLGDNGDKAIAILDSLGLNNQRVINSLLSVANAAATSGEENARLAESIGIANEAFKKFGDTLDDYNALQLESERRFATTANQIKLLKNQMTDLGITVGAVVLPTLRKLVDVVRAVARRIEQLARTEGGQQLVKLAVGAGLVLAIIGPLIVAFGLLLSAIGFIGLAIVKVIAFFGLLFSWFGILAAPILAVAAAVTGLAVAFIASFRKIDQISGDAAKGMIPAMWEFGKELILAFARGMAAAMGAVIQVLIAIGEILSTWLSPGSPPKIAPELDKWGEEAMNTYLQGWLSADFDVFNDITGKIESYLRSISRELGDGLIPKIIGSRKLIAEAVDEIK
jgi:TP901 family phage tail tape measure protein